MITMLYILVGMIATQLFIVLVFLYKIENALDNLSDTLEMLRKERYHEEEAENDHAS